MAQGDPPVALAGKTWVFPKARQLGHPQSLNGWSAPPVLTTNSINHVRGVRISFYGGKFNIKVSGQIPPLMLEAESALALADAMLEASNSGAFGVRVLPDGSCRVICPSPKGRRTHRLEALLGKGEMRSRTFLPRDFREVANRLRELVENAVADDVMGC